MAANGQAHGGEFPRVAGFPVCSYPFCGSQTAGILEYVEDLKRVTNKDIGPKDIFETASNTFFAHVYSDFESSGQIYFLKNV